MALNSNSPQEYPTCFPPPYPPVSCCPPLVGPTGPDGPRSFSQSVETPTFVVSAVLNIPSIPLVQFIDTHIPFNLSFGGNLMGNAAFNFNTGIFKVPISGIYSVDYQISFATTPSVANVLSAGSRVGALLRQNEISLQNSAFVFPTASNTSFTLNESFKGSITESFNVGDKISILVQSSIGLAPTFVTGAIFNNVPPFNTVLTIRSMF